MLESSFPFLNHISIWSFRSVADLETKRQPDPNRIDYFDWTWAFILQPVTITKLGC